MKSVAFALLLVAGCSDVDPYPVVVPASNPPALAQAHENPNPTGPDAGTGSGSGGLADAGVISDGGAPGFDALPTAFDAGAPTDVGSPAADAGVPPNP